MSDSSISHRMLRGDVEFLLKKWPRPGNTNTFPMIAFILSICPLSCHPDVCGLTGHSDADISRCSGSGLSMRWAELVQVHRRMVVVTQQHPVAARCLTDAQTLNIQHNTVHTGETGLGTDGHQLMRVQVLLLVMSASTHRDSKSLEDVEFTDGTGAVFIQPRVHAHFMENMSADGNIYHQTDQWGY